MDEEDIALKSVRIDSQIKTIRELLSKSGNHQLKIKWSVYLDRLLLEKGRLIKEIHSNKKKRKA